MSYIKPEVAVLASNLRMVACGPLSVENIVCFNLKRSTKIVPGEEATVVRWEPVNAGEHSYAGIDTIWLEEYNKEGHKVRAFEPQRGDMLYYEVVLRGDQRRLLDGNQD